MLPSSKNIVHGLVAGSMHPPPLPQGTCDAPFFYLYCPSQRLQLFRIGKTESDITLVSMDTF